MAYVFCWSLQWQLADSAHVHAASGMMVAHIRNCAHEMIHVPLCVVSSSRGACGIPA